MVLDDEEEGDLTTIEGLVATKQVEWNFLEIRKTKEEMQPNSRS